MFQRVETSRKSMKCTRSRTVIHYFPNIYLAVTLSSLESTEFGDRTCKMRQNSECYFKSEKAVENI